MPSKLILRVYGLIFSSPSFLAPGSLGFLGLSRFYNKPLLIFF
ncbi:hypothetical protein HHE02_04970 [Helicobacter heilmannii]|nr:hypothetical protein HHE02_04970 [Helicobacter heilmannii]